MSALPKFSAGRGLQRRGLPAWRACIPLRLSGMALSAAGRPRAVQEGRTGMHTEDR